MRGALIVGLAIVVLIVGMLVIKNMGSEKSGGVTETQAEQYIDQAKDVADKAKERIKHISDQLPSSD